MKKCCKKWNENDNICIESGDLGCQIPKNDINFCPECDSSLKEESKWCDFTLQPHLKLKRDEKFLTFSEYNDRLFVITSKRIYEIVKERE